MAGQGFHIGLNKKLISKIDIKLFLDKRFIAGTLIPDSLKALSVSKRNSHYCGGGSLKYPPYEKLTSFVIDDLALDDKKIVASYITDPEVQLGQFFEKNEHLSNQDPYKLGIMMHLLSDHEYDKLISDIIFDLSKQVEGIIILNKKEITGDEWRKTLYSLYPMLDQYTLEKNGVVKEDIISICRLVCEIFPPNMSEFLVKYINYDTDKKFVDNEYFSKNCINDLYSKIYNEWQGIQKKLIK